MNDVYYIIVAVIFGLFVIVTCVWMYRYLRKPLPLLATSHEELSDEQKQMLEKFCGEMKRERLRKEEEGKSRAKKRNKKGT